MVGLTINKYLCSFEGPLDKWLVCIACVRQHACIIILAALLHSKVIFDYWSIFGQLEGSSTCINKISYSSLHFVIPFLFFSKPFYFFLFFIPFFTVLSILLFLPVLPIHFSPSNLFLFNVLLHFAFFPSFFKIYNVENASGQNELIN